MASLKKYVISKLKFCVLITFATTIFYFIEGKFDSNMTWDKIQFTPLYGECHPIFILLNIDFLKKQIFCLDQISFVGIRMMSTILWMDPLILLTHASTMPCFRNFIRSNSFLVFTTWYVLIIKWQLPIPLLIREDST